MQFIITELALLEVCACLMSLRETHLYVWRWEHLPKFLGVQLLSLETLCELQLNELQEILDKSLLMGVFPTFHG